MATTDEGLQNEFLNVNGIRMHYVTMGNKGMISLLRRTTRLENTEG